MIQMMKMVHHRDGQLGESEGIKAMDIYYNEWTLINILHGYIPDENYTPVDMKDDDYYSEDLNWNFL